MGLAPLQRQCLASRSIAPFVSNSAIIPLSILYPNKGAIIKLSTLQLIYTVLGINHWDTFTQASKTHPEHECKSDCKFFPLNE